jgi:O-antigen/teichoic acid export membrane protein
VTLKFGTDGFATLAIAQSLGLAAAVVCELGWSVVGPQIVARSNSPARGRLYLASVGSRLTALAIGAPIVAVAATLVSSFDQAGAGVVAVSYAVGALTPSWLLVGMNRPGLLLAADTLPRLALNIAASLAVLAGAPLGVVAIANLGATATSLVVVSRVFSFRMLPTRADFRRGRRTARLQLGLTFGRAVSVTYTSLVTPLLGVLSPSSVPLYAATDRIMRMGLNVLTGFPNRLQSWVGAVPRESRHKRSRASLAANAALGIVAGTVFYFVAPPASEILFVGAIVLDNSIVLLGAAVVAAICLSRGAGLSLIAEGKRKWIPVANVTAAVLGLGGLLLLAPTRQAEGAMTSVLLAEGAGIAVQLIALFWSRAKPEDAGSEASLS